MFFFHDQLKQLLLLFVKSLAFLHGFRLAAVAL